MPTDEPRHCPARHPLRRTLAAWSGAAKLVGLAASLLLALPGGPAAQTLAQTETGEDTAQPTEPAALPPEPTREDLPRVVPTPLTPAPASTDPEPSRPRQLTALVHAATVAREAAARVAERLPPLPDVSAIAHATANAVTARLSGEVPLFSGLPDPRALLPELPLTLPDRESLRALVTKTFPATAIARFREATAPYWTPEVAGFFGRLWPMLIPVAALVSILAVWRASIVEAHAPEPSPRATHPMVQPGYRSPARQQRDAATEPATPPPETWETAPPERRASKPDPQTLAVTKADAAPSATPGSPAPPKQPSAAAMPAPAAIIGPAQPRANRPSGWAAGPARKPAEKPVPPPANPARRPKQAAEEVRQSARPAPARPHPRSKPKKAAAVAALLVPPQVASAPVTRPGIDPPQQIDGLDPDEVLTILAAPPPDDLATPEVSLAASPQGNLTRVFLGDACVAVVTGTQQVALDQINLIFADAPAPEPAPRPEPAPGKAPPLPRSAAASPARTEPVATVEGVAPLEPVAQVEPVEPVEPGTPEITFEVDAETELEAAEALDAVSNGAPRHIPEVLLRRKR